MFVWIYLRHYLNIKILISEFTEFKTVGPYELNWETEQYKCNISHWISTALLASLQSLNLFWLFYIIRIAYRFVFAGVAEDDRSDNEEVELAEEARQAALEQEAERLRIEGKPALMLNGDPLSPINGHTSGIDIKTDKLTNRKVEVRK